MFALYLAAIILLGNLLGSFFAMILKLARAKERRDETDYGSVFGPAFNAGRVTPTRVTYRASRVREEMAKLAEEDMRIAA